MVSYELRPSQDGTGGVAAWEVSNGSGWEGLGFIVGVGVFDVRGEREVLTANCGSVGAQVDFLRAIVDVILWQNSPDFLHNFGIERVAISRTNLVRRATQDPHVLDGDYGTIVLGARVNNRVVIMVDGEDHIV